jgi:iron(III) transport system substrate-binding protein
MTDDTPRANGEDHSFVDRQVDRRSFLRWSAGVGGLALVGGIAGRGVQDASATTLSAAQTGSSSVEKIRLTATLVKAAQKEGTLLFRYSDPQPSAQIWANNFKKTYGINVQLDRKVGILGNQAFEAEAQAGKHVMDVNHNSDPLGLVQLDNDGYYLNYSLPDVDPHVPKYARLRNVGYCDQIDQICIGYNPQKISTTAAVELFSKQNWNGLLDKSLSRGKIGMTDPGGGATPYGTYQMFYQTPKYGEAFFAKLAKQSPKVYAGSAPGLEDLASGAIWVYATSWTATAMQNFTTGNQTRWTYTSDVMPAFPDIYFGINKDAPHPNAARLFVAWMMSVKGQISTEQAQIIPMRTDVKTRPPAEAKLKKTSWWKPFPTKIGYVPNINYWIKNYNTLMPEMRQVLGYQA